MRYLTIALFLIVVSGCAVRTVPLEEATYTQNDSEIYAFCKKMNLKDEKPNLIIIRDEGFYGSKNPHMIHIDGKPCADLMPGEKLSLTLAPGEHILGTKNKWDPFSIGRLIETEITIRGNKTSIVRDGVDANGVHHINLSAK
jgi:hypothetical protein